MAFPVNIVRLALIFASPFIVLNLTGAALSTRAEQKRAQMAAQLANSKNEREFKILIDADSKRFTTRIEELTNKDRAAANTLILQERDQAGNSLLMNLFLQKLDNKNQEKLFTWQTKVCFLIDVWLDQLAINPQTCLELVKNNKAKKTVFQIAQERRPLPAAVSDKIEKLLKAMKTGVTSVVEQKINQDSPSIPVSTNTTPATPLVDVPAAAAPESKSTPENQTQSMDFDTFIQQCVAYQIKFEFIKDIPAFKEMLHRTGTRGAADTIFNAILRTPNALDRIEKLRGLLSLHETIKPNVIVRDQDKLSAVDLEKKFPTTPDIRKMIEALAVLQTQQTALMFKLTQSSKPQDLAEIQQLLDAGVSPLSLNPTAPELRQTILDSLIAHYIVCPDEYADDAFDTVVARIVRTGCALQKQSLGHLHKIVVTRALNHGRFQIPEVLLTRSKNTRKAFLDVGCEIDDKPLFIIALDSKSVHWKKLFMLLTEFLNMRSEEQNSATLNAMNDRGPIIAQLIRRPLTATFTKADKEKMVLRIFSLGALPNIVISPFLATSEKKQFGEATLSEWAQSVNCPDTIIALLQTLERKADSINETELVSPLHLRVRKLNQGIASVKDEVAEHLWRAMDGLGTLALELDCANCKQALDEYHRNDDAFYISMLLRGQDRNGNTILMRLITSPQSKERDEKIKLLIDFGANLLLHNNLRQTAYSLSEIHCSAEIQNQLRLNAQMQAVENNQLLQRYQKRVALSKEQMKQFQLKREAKIKPTENFETLASPPATVLDESVPNLAPLDAGLLYSYAPRFKAILQAWRAEIPREMTKWVNTRAQQLLQQLVTVSLDDQLPDRWEKIEYLMEVMSDYPDWLDQDTLAPTLQAIENSDLAEKIKPAFEAMIRKILEIPKSVNVNDLARAAHDIMPLIQELNALERPTTQQVDQIIKSLLTSNLAKFKVMLDIIAQNPTLLKAVLDWKNSDDGSTMLIEIINPQEELVADPEREAKVRFLMGVMFAEYPQSLLAENLDGDSATDVIKSIGDEVDDQLEQDLDDLEKRAIILINQLKKEQQALQREKNNSRLAAPETQATSSPAIAPALPSQAKAATPPHEKRIRMLNVEEDFPSGNTPVIQEQSGFIDSPVSHQLKQKDASDYLLILDEEKFEPLLLKLLPTILQSSKNQKNLLQKVIEQKTDHQAAQTLKNSQIILLLNYLIATISIEDLEQINAKAQAQEDINPEVKKRIAKKLRERTRKSQESAQAAASSSSVAPAERKEENRTPSPTPSAQENDSQANDQEGPSSLEKKRHKPKAVSRPSKLSKDQKKRLKRDEQRAQIEAEKKKRAALIAQEAAQEVNAREIKNQQKNREALRVAEQERLERERRAEQGRLELIKQQEAEQKQREEQAQQERIRQQEQEAAAAEQVRNAHEKARLQQEQLNHQKQEHEQEQRRRQALERLRLDKEETLRRIEFQKQQKMDEQRREQERIQQQAREAAAQKEHVLEMARAQEGLRIEQEQRQLEAARLAELNRIERERETLREQEAQEQNRREQELTIKSLLRIGLYDISTAATCAPASSEAIVTSSSTLMSDAPALSCLATASTMTSSRADEEKKESSAGTVHSATTSRHVIPNEPELYELFWNEHAQPNTRAILEEWGAQVAEFYASHWRNPEYLWRLARVLIRKGMHSDYNAQLAKRTSTLLAFNAVLRRIHELNRSEILDLALDGSETLLSLAARLNSAAFYQTLIENNVSTVVGAVDGIMPHDFAISHAIRGDRHLLGLQETWSLLPMLRSALNQLNIPADSLKKMLAIALKSGTIPSTAPKH